MKYFDRESEYGGSRNAPMMYYSDYPTCKKCSVKGERVSVEERLRCFGEVKVGYTGGIEMMHPDYRYLNTEAGEDLLLSDRLFCV